MASDEETLLAWLKSVATGEAANALKVLEDVLDARNGAMREVVGDITGVQEPSEPVSALENWLQSKKLAFVVDPTDARAVGKAALGAAVHCDGKQEYIRKMMELDQDYQASLMVLIDEFNRDVERDELDQRRAIMKKMARKNAALRHAAEEREQEAHASDVVVAGGHAAAAADAAVAKQLQDRVKELERRLVAADAHAEEVELELQDAKEQLAEATRGVEDRVSQYEEELRAQADELDVARTKAAQLIKAEAKVAKLMQKLEESSQLRARLKELEDESQQSLARKIELEAEMKSIGTLRQQLETYKAKASDLESQLAQHQRELRAKEEQLAQAAAKLKASADSEKFLKDQLEASTDAIAQLEAEVDMAQGGGGGGAAGPTRGGLAADLSAAAASTPRESAASKLEKQRLEQRVAALTSENEALKAKVEEAAAEARRDAALGATPDHVSRLAEELKAKEEECKQHVNDKEKLKAFVRQSLSATQEKYKMTLQTKQSQIDEQQEMIRNFKSIREEDDETHKREQRLVMSSFYELGFEMQRRAALKSQTSGSWLNRQRTKV